MFLQHRHLPVHIATAMEDTIPTVEGSARRARIPNLGILNDMPHYLRFVILLAAGWINSDQQKIIDYLLEEIRVYRKHFNSPRLRFTDAQRRRLGVKAKALRRKPLEQFAGIVTPDTLLR